MGKQRQQLDGELVGHALVDGGDAPMGAEFLAFIEAEHDVGVADVDAEQHGYLVPVTNSTQSAPACRAPLASRLSPVYN